MDIPLGVRDEEVLGLDNGIVVQWDAEAGAPYLSGETLEDFGVDNLLPVERERCGLRARD